MPFGHWDEIRTALHVGRSGSISAAGKELSLHHATVIRHVTTLEERLATKLFHRSQRGYSLTDAGEQFLAAAERMEAAASEVVIRAEAGRGQVSGQLILTSVPILSGLVTDVAYDLIKQHPALNVTFCGDNRVLRLDRGEAHVALRPGARPQEPDYVVVELPAMAFALYGSHEYVSAHPDLPTLDDLGNHRFIGTDGEEVRAPHYAWLAQRIKPDRMRFISADPVSRLQTIIRGVGLGFLPVRSADRVGTLVQVIPPLADWAVPLWLVTHRDSHRTPKVRAASDTFRKYAHNYRFN